MVANFSSPLDLRLFLDGKHTIFGKVVTDLDNSLAKIEALGSRRGRTKEEVKIIKASIRIADSE